MDKIAGILPSKRFIVWVVIAVFIVGISALAFGTTQKKPPAASPVEETPERAQARAFLAHDSDQDGLKDWEETLWGTDPENTDTDGDETPDGEEVSLGRNPLVAGPNDSLAGGSFETRSLESATTSGPLTQTEALSQALFTQYIGAEQAGIEINAGNAQALVSTLVGGTLSQNTTPAPQFTLQDISVVSVSDPAALRAYGNVVGSVFAETLTAENNEILALGAFAQSGVTAQAQNLEPVLTSYEQKIENLQRIPVPQLFTRAHLTLLNGLALITTGISGFSALESDPFAALLTIQHYETGTTLVAEAVTLFQKTFSTYKVTFNATEAGHVLMQGQQP